MFNSHCRQLMFCGMFCFLTFLILCSCNASIENVAKKPVKIDKKYQSAIHYDLVPVLDVESFGNIKIKDMDLGKYYYDRVQQYAFKSMGTDLDENLYSTSDKVGYNGYVKCTLVSHKNKTKCWEIIPSVLTLFYYNLCGGPVAHTTVERVFRFDIYDALGDEVRTFTFKGIGKIQHALYSNSNFEGAELKAFRSALKQFEVAVAKDAYYINGKLKYGAEELEAKINRPIGESDLKLCNWLNSGKMPTEQELNDAIDKKPKDYSGWGLRAKNNADKGHFNAALSDIDEYCKLNPACNIIRPYFMKGMLLYKLNRKSEAYEALCVADQLHPEDESIKIMIGTLLCDAGAYNLALPVFNEASKINPDNIETIHNISQLREVCEQLTQEREKAQIDESMRRTMAMQMVANASSNAVTSISNIANSNSKTNTTSSGTTAVGGSSGNARKAGPKTRECSMCHGKGWVAGTSSVSFDSSTSYYCDECHRNVPSSHSHDQCPSCRGNGKVTTIR